MQGPTTYPIEFWMDFHVAEQIHEIWHDVHSKSIAFPETVKRLMQLGVGRYHVDYVAQTITSYIGGSVDVANVSGRLEKVERKFTWDGDKVREAILKVQGGSVSYGEFSKLIIESGVTNYWAYLDGRRVIYMGDLGDFHVEWFPGAKP